MAPVILWDLVASTAGLDPRQIAELEEHRELNPPVSVLSRYAAAVGHHLQFGLSPPESAGLGQTSAS